MRENKKLAYLSRELATIILDLDLDFELADTEWDYSGEQTAYELFQKYEFRSLLSKIPKLDKQSSEVFNNKESYKLIDNQKDFNEFIIKLKKEDEICLDTETDSLDSNQATLLGISFSWQAGQAYYVLAQENFLKELKPIIENKKVIGHHIKYDYKVLKLAGLELKNIYFDTLVAAYLLSKTNRSLKLDDLAFSELAYRMQPIEDLIGKKGKDQLNMRDVDYKKISNYSCEDADYTWQLYQKYKKELKKETMLGLFS
ncbi:hypothetical protein K8R66_01020, partial [bacterium]|nr:hypothetical protein [bacterium]